MKLQDFNEERTRLWIERGRPEPIHGLHDDKNAMHVANGLHCDICSGNLFDVYPAEARAYIYYEQPTPPTIRVRCARCGTEDTRVF